MFQSILLSSKNSVNFPPSINITLSPNKNWKCIKFEGGLKAVILALVGPMEIRDFAALANKSKLVEEYNKKLANTRLED